MKVTIKNLSKSFGTELILKNINLVLPSKSRIALIGSNGSGKSTFLRALMDIIAYQGQILFDDQPCSIDTKMNSAYVPQISPYFSSLVKDVVETTLALRNISIDDFKDVLIQLNLNYDSIANASFRKMSGGMKQKLLIALAFSSRPKLLLLDEPTASLDPSARNSFYQLCKQLKQATIILCSHRLDEIHHLVDEVVAFDEGTIDYQGDSESYLKKVLQ